MGIRVNVGNENVNSVMVWLYYTIDIFVAYIYSNTH